MTAEPNSQSTQPSNPSAPAQSSRTAYVSLPQTVADVPDSNGLPPVGDLSKITEDPALGLDLNIIETVPQADDPRSVNPADHTATDAQPPIAIPANPSGSVPFAPSQAIPADPIPAGLAAKAAASKLSGSSPPTTEEATTNQAAGHAPTAAAADQSTPTVAAIDAAPLPAASQSVPTLVEGNHAPQVRFKNDQGKMLLILPSERDDSSGQNTLSYAWVEIMHQLRQRLQAEARHWSANTAVHLIARDRLLSAQQLQDIVDALASQKIQLRRVYTSRRQTAITAATAGYSIEQHVAVSQLKPAPTEAGQAMAEPLILKTTLRSGAEIRHNGTVVVIGDLNPGSAIVAEGDVVVWGRLRGNVHAGCKGDDQARIMALRMEPAQIRIAGFVARGPANPPTQFFPEVAYVTAEAKISIARVEDLREMPSQVEPNRTSGSRKLPATGKRNFE